MISTGKIKIIVSLVLSLQLCALSASGWCMTTPETNGYKMIPIAHWLTLTRELQTQKDELIQLQTLLQKLRRPSDQLQQELKTAKEQLEKSQAELQNARISLTGASSALAESQTSLQTLKQGIEKERRVHRRQIWQNRFWFLVAGAAIGVAAAK